MLSMRVMTYHLNVWKICGTWMHLGQPRWYSVYSLLFVGFVFCMFPMCSLLSLIFTTSIQEVVDTIMVCSTCLLTSIKTFFLMSNKQRIRELFTIFDQLDAIGIKTNEHRAIINVAIQKSWRIIYLLSFLYYGGINMAFILCMRNTEPILLWPAWFPLIPYQNGDQVFYSLLAYQYVSTLFIGLMDTSMDTYGSALSKVLAAHLDVLKMRLRGLGGEQHIGMDKERYWESELNECVEYYDLCTKFSRCLDTILSKHYLTQFGCSSLIICVSAFQLSTLQPLSEPSEFLFVFEYLLSMTIEIFIPCYFGSLVTVKSTQLANSIYSCNWIEQSQEFRSTMRIFVERSIRPLVPFAGGLFVIGLPTFVSILRTAYSMLSLLKSIE